MYRGIVAVIMFIAVLLTLSRASIIIATIAILMYLLAFLYGALRRSLAGRGMLDSGGVIAGAAVIGVSLFIVSQSNALQQGAQVLDSLSTRVEMLGESSQSRSTIAIREEMNDRAIDAFVSSPLVGIGYRGTVYMWSAFESSALSNSTFRVHNVYLALLAEGGLIVLFCYLFLTLFPAYRLVRSSEISPDVKRAILGSLIFCYAFSFTSLTMFSKYVTPLYMLLLGMAMGMTRSGQAAPRAPRGPSRAVDPRVRTPVA